MRKKLGVIIATVFVILLILLMLFVSGLLYYRKSIIADREECYNRWSEQLHVDSNYVEIGNGLLIKIKDAINVGMSKEGVTQVLLEIAPNKVTFTNETSKGTVDFVTLEICSRFQNNIDYLIYYSFDGEFQEIRLDTSD